MFLKYLDSNHIDKFLSKHYTRILVILLVIAAILRFYNFYDHLAFESDTTRDISIAKEAIERKEIPQMGSFSSAGPFVFGPAFYWFLIISYLILPFSIIAPWFATGILGLLAVFATIYIGKLIGGARFAVILAILSVTSPQLIFSSVSLTHHVFVLFSTIATLICLILLWQKRLFVYAFLTGIFIGIAINMHHQAINLLLVIPALLLVPKTQLRDKFCFFLLGLLGVFVISFPFLYWDAKQNWANIRNLLDYLLIAQQRIYVPNSWRLFLLSYFPDLWALNIGGIKIISFIIMVLLGIISPILLIKKRIEPEVFVLGTLFFIMIIISRYYKGERSAGYFYFMTPFFLLFSGWIIYKISSLNLFLPFKKININNALSILLLIVLISGNLYRAIPTILNKSSGLSSIKKALEDLSIKYPEGKFRIYSYKAINPNITYALSVFLEDRKRLDNDSGIPLGTCKDKDCPPSAVVATSLFGVSLLDLNDVNINNEINLSGWNRVSQEDIYNSTIGWLRAGNLRSTFSLTSYIKERLGLAR